MFVSPSSPPDDIDDFEGSLDHTVIAAPVSSVLTGFMIAVIILLVVIIIVQRQRLKNQTNNDDTTYSNLAYSNSKYIELHSAQGLHKYIYIYSLKLSPWPGDEAYALKNLGMRLGIEKLGVVWG